jgi:hypothetical protein
MCASSAEPDSAINDDSPFGRTKTDDEVFGPDAAVAGPPGMTAEAGADDDHWDKLKDCSDKIRSLADSVKAHRGDVPRMDPAKESEAVRQDISRLHEQLSHPAGLAAALRGPPPAGGPLVGRASQAMGDLSGHAFDAVYQLLTMAADIAQDTLAKRHAGNGAPPRSEPPPPGAPNPETT